MEKTVGKTVLIVQPLDVVRYGLIHIITFSSEMRVCAEARNLAHAGVLIANQKPDLVIIDATMEEGSGFRFLQRIKDEWLNTHSVVFSRSLNSDEILRAVKCGAAAVLLHDHKQEMIMDTLVNIAEGRVHDALLRTIAEDVRRGQNPNPEIAPEISQILTKRETEVFRLLGLGMTVKQIAAELNISSRTIETHEARMKEKLGARDTNQLRRRAVLSMKPDAARSGI